VGRTSNEGRFYETKKALKRWEVLMGKSEGKEGPADAVQHELFKKLKRETG